MVPLTHPDVAAVSVIGHVDPQWGEPAVAHVVPKEGAMLRPAALDALCLERLAPFKRPKAYERIDELPKNNCGKVLKTALRGLHATRVSEEQKPIVAG